MRFDRADDTREALEALDDSAPSWRYIYDTLVEEKEETIRTGKKKKENIIKIAVRGDYKQILDPYAGMPYPSSRAGMLTRVTRKYMGHWINFPRLTRDLCRIPKIEKAMSEARQTRTGKIELTTDVGCRIGTLTYSSEWAQVKASKQIDDILEPVTEITQDANNILAKTLEDKIIYHFRSGKKRRLRIMDIGTGSGNTIMPVMRIMENLARRKIIPKEYLNYVQIFLVDVSRHSLEKTFDRITSTSPMLRTLRQMTPAGNIVPISVNFADIENNKILNHYKGKIDIGTAGAAPCHLSDQLPFFRKMYSLLAFGGILNIWDWYNGPSWAAPRLKLSKDG
ncbi:class I SAM-dependent methyltransferase [Candidatus Woesearchaeota archaeon]|nr:class I SAM-dependent methyltransferase [Candidatus Woesearchaeota archaeon]